MVTTKSDTPVQSPVRLRLLADENMPLVAHYFADFADIHFANGRTISNADLRDIDILLVRSVTKVNAELLANTQVKFVGSATIGKDHVDLDYLREQGIGFASAPGCNANAVVQYVVTALSQVLGEDLFKSKVAIVGCGNVGSSLYRKLRQLEIDCIAYDPYLEGRANLRFGAFEQVLKADVICLHTPLEKYTQHPSYHLFDEAAINALKPGALLLNAGRGAVIDNRALLRRLETQGDLRTVLDVWEFEPELLLDLLPLVDIATPHIAGYSHEGKTKGTQMVYQACMRFFDTEPQLSAPESAKLGFDAPCQQQDLATLLAQAYDVKRDDAELRASQEASLSALERAEAFDLLRKNYRVRREFENYRIAGVKADKRRMQLGQLGFEVV